jgi:hypothetical protein
MSRTDNAVEIAAVDAEEWEVECIVDHRGKTKRNAEFRIRWKGYGPNDDSWLPWKEARDLEAMDVYLKSHRGLKI